MSEAKLVILLLAIAVPFIYYIGMNNAKTHSQNVKVCKEKGGVLTKLNGSSVCISGDYFINGDWDNG
jgi:hypothetical protein